MLPAKNRLTRGKDFKRINSSGKSFFSFYFRLKYLANNQELSRFGIVVSTKVSKRANKRNRIKRQIREIIRLNKTKIKFGYDLIIFVKNSALNQKYQDLERDLGSILAKAKLLK